MLRVYLDERSFVAAKLNDLDRNVSSQSSHARFVSTDSRFCANLLLMIVTVAGDEEPR